MTFRAKSRKRQWTRWLCAALVASAVYIVVSRLLFGSVSLDLLDPVRYRLALSLAVLFGLFAWETRWDGVKRVTKTPTTREDVGERPAAVSVERPTEARPAVRGDEALLSEAAVREVPVCEVPPAPSTSAPSAADAVSGEELFEQARALPHLPIPDFCSDREYLDLLGQSAAKGYAPALVKLGEYAMRRGAWVESYYWMVQARRSGMHGLSPVLREIRMNWSLEDFPDEELNVSKLFTEEAGSLGRALLHVDSGHEAGMAKEFLRTHYPEYLG